MPPKRNKSGWIWFPAKFVPELCFTPWLKSSVTCSRQKNKGFTFVEAVEFKVNFLQNCFPRPAMNGATLFTAWTLFQSCEIFEFQNVNLGHTGVSFLGCHYQHFTSKLTCSWAGLRKRCSFKHFLCEFRLSLDKMAFKLAPGGDLFYLNDETKAAISDLIYKLQRVPEGMQELAKASKSETRIVVLNPRTKTLIRKILVRQGTLPQGLLQLAHTVFETGAIPPNHLPDFKAKMIPAQKTKQEEETSKRPRETCSTESLPPVDKYAKVCHLLRLTEVPFTMRRRGNWVP